MPTVISIVAITMAVIFTFGFLIREDTVPPPPALSVAVLLSAALELFDLLVFYDAQKLYVWKKLSLVAEVLLVAAWLWFSLNYIRQQSGKFASPPFSRLLLAFAPIIACFTLILPAEFFIYSPDFGTEKTLFLSNAGFLFYIAILVYLVSALANLEHAYIHAEQPSRWKIKFELMGVGAFLVMLTLYYSQGLIFRTINMQLLPARSLVLLVALAMIAYSWLKRGSGVKVRLSQQMARRSAVLLAVGLYIIAFGLAGEGMKYFGDGFQQAMILAMVFLAGVGLFVILLSETVKRKVTVFIHKNFYQNKYDYRTQWLQFTDRLSASQTSAELLRSIVSEFCETFGMGTGAMFVLNQERDIYQQRVGIAMDDDDVVFSINDASVKKLLESRSILDLRAEAALAVNDSHNELFREQNVCFIIPLIMKEVVEGFIILGKPLNSSELYGFEDLDLMGTLAKQASATLINLSLSEQLACSREQAAIGKVSAFVLHDLKNLVSSISLMLENAREHITLPAFQDDMLVSLGNTVVKMKTLISRLKHLPEKNSLQLAPVDLLQMAHETAAMINGKSLAVTGTRVIAEGDRDELQKVALNLMLNAVEATHGDTPVTVEVGESQHPYFRVKDSGCGISPAFLQQTLFKPFCTTKKAGLGIGLYQSKQIIEAHGGTIEVVSRINHGSEFTVWLPKMQPS